MYINQNKYMKYSIIIAVYNRIDEVKELLGSAEELDFPRQDFELFFVDDGSKDGFKNFIENYNSPSGLNTRAIYQKNQGPGTARNNGMAHSASDYFIFVDSDCMFPPNYLEELDKHVAEFDACGGPDTGHPSFSPLLKAISYSMTSFIGTGGTRGKSEKVGKFYPRSFNMCLSRKVYETIGGMNKLRHGQDMDFSARIVEAGFKTGLVKDAFVYHKRRTSIAKFYRQIFNWGVARINLGKLHPSLSKPVHYLPAMVVLGVVFVALLSIIFYQCAGLIWSIMGIGFGAVCLFAFLESGIKNKSVKIGFLSIITLNIQVFAYGFGLIKALWQTKIQKKEEAEGFVKNYYSKKKLESR